ncbi:MAG: glucosyltransferase domain-containing protein [Lachnospiraceae bacterium]|nr:glucosyltransferase domain-containing protein [Lachnospiraceae bacterium]
MFIKLQSTKEKFWAAFGFSALFYLMAHGYRFMNTAFSGDSLITVHQNDAAWEIALGRYVQPLLIMFRGSLESSYLICMISLIFMGLSAYLIVDFLEIEKLFSVIAICAVLTCNLTVTATNATYLGYSDFYIIALFLSVAGVWLLKKDNLLCILSGTFILGMSMGTYQAYICVSIGLVMIYYIFEMLKAPDFKKTATSVIKYFCAFLGAAVIYFVIWKLFQHVFGIWTADSYNGMAGIGDYSTVSLGTVLTDTYRKVLQYFWEVSPFATVTYHGKNLSLCWIYLQRLCNVAVVALTIGILVWRNRKVQTALWHKLTQGLLLLIFPMGINFISLLTKGMQHTLMIYAFVLVYVLAVKATDDADIEQKTVKSISPKAVPRIAVLLFLGVLTWSNIVYANQVYLKKELQDKAALSRLTRIVQEIETMEGYIPGETSVAFFGSFERNPHMAEAEAFKEILPYGMGKTALTYEGTYYAYLNYIMDVKMKFVQVSDADERIKQMPCYPERGSVVYVDDTVVVKISEIN